MTDYISTYLSRPRWRHNRLQAMGVQWTYRAPEVGELVIRDATQTHPAPSAESSASAKTHVTAAPYG
ncbi:hypothetical protein SAMN04488548_11841 [Gordonia westfalica]|uniref:Uncharacterized protein n=1 Tax=Gordonia westfalica TaxID=158898 RepID=A0A1H2DRB4_9ACTN|nr:hypothetical protein SAMN04488548_11841 [Gordonia westfalica]